MSHHQNKSGAVARIVSDFCTFYGLGERLQNISNALNCDKTFERTVVVIGLAGFVVIGLTL